MIEPAPSFCELLAEAHRETFTDGDAVARTPMTNAEDAARRPARPPAGRAPRAAPARSARRAARRSRRRSSRGVRSTPVADIAPPRDPPARPRPGTAAAPAAAGAPPGWAPVNGRISSAQPSGVRPAQPVERLRTVSATTRRMKATREDAPSPSSSASRRVEASWLTSAPTADEHDTGTEAIASARAARTRPTARPRGHQPEPESPRRATAAPASDRRERGAEGGAAADRARQDQLVAPGFLLAAHAPNGRRAAPRTAAKIAQHARRPARRRSRRRSAGRAARRRRAGAPCCRRSSARTHPVGERRVGAGGSAIACPRA